MPKLAATDLLGTSTATAPEVGSTQAEEIDQSAAISRPATITATPEKRLSTKKIATSNTKAKVKSASSKQAKPSSDKVEFAGETGPNTSVTVNGETQWQIAGIDSAEGDILLVRWTGWPGLWEEPRDSIAETAPVMLAAFEKREKAKSKSRTRAETETGKGVKRARGRPPASRVQKAMTTTRPTAGPKMRKPPKVRTPTSPAKKTKGTSGSGKVGRPRKHA